MATERHKTYIPSQKLNAKGSHTDKRLVLTKINLNLYQMCILNKSQKKYDTMMDIIPRP